MALLRRSKRVRSTPTFLEMHMDESCETYEKRPRVDQSQELDQLLGPESDENSMSSDQDSESGDDDGYRQYLAQGELVYVPAPSSDDDTEEYVTDAGSDTEDSD